MIFPPGDLDRQKFASVLGINLVDLLKKTLDGLIRGQIGNVFTTHVCLDPLWKRRQHKILGSQGRCGATYARTEGNKSDTLVTECLGILYRQHVEGRLGDFVRRRGCLQER